MDRIDTMFLSAIVGSLVGGTILTYVAGVTVPSSGAFVGAIEFINSVLEAIGYIGIFLLAFLEIIYPPIPGELVLPFVGFLVASGKFNIVVAILAASLGNVLGMYGIYLISMRLGRPFIERYGKYFLMDERHLELAEEFFDKYGNLAVLFGRMIPAYREIISVPAGLGRMGHVRFLIYTFIGSLTWDTILIGAGYILRQNYVVVKVWFDKVDIFIWASVVLAVMWFIIKGRMRKRKAL